MVERGNFGERQDDSRRDWGYYKHLSIYAFAAPFVAGRRCLEIGSGSGYGSRLLLEAGAASLLAIDKDVAGLDALRRDYPAVDVLACDLDLDGLEVPPATHDVVFSSNVFEHLVYPDSTLAAAAAALVDDGLFIIAVPPVASIDDLVRNGMNIFHVTNIPPRAWAAKLRRYFHDVAAFRHWIRSGTVSPEGEVRGGEPCLDNFTFAPDAGDAPTINSIFVARRPRRPPIAQPVEEEGCPQEWRPAKVEADARQAMVVKLKTEIDEARRWAEDARRKGADMNFILDSVCRQLRFLCDQAES
jgi:SAM-dependent methyltransferase